MQQVVQILGNENAAADYLKKCIYSVGLGSNDYLNNYFMPLYYPTSRQFTPDQYATVLIQQYTQQLKVSCIPPLLFTFICLLALQKKKKQSLLINNYMFSGDPRFYIVMEQGSLL